MQIHMTVLIGTIEVTHTCKQSKWDNLWNEVSDTGKTVTCNYKIIFIYFFNEKLILIVCKISIIVLKNSH